MEVTILIGLFVIGLASMSLLLGTVVVCFVIEMFDRLRALGHHLDLLDAGFDRQRERIDDWVMKERKPGNEQVPDWLRYPKKK